MYGKTKELRDMLYFRYLLLKQGECPELNPELKSYIADHYDVAMNFGKAPLRPSEDVSTSPSKCSIDYNAFQSFLKDMDLEYCTDVYVERLLKVNEDKKIAHQLLKRISRPGIDGILKNISCIYLHWNMRISLVNRCG